MRIGTWNVEYAKGETKNTRRRERLLRMNCDVWVLTETHDDLDLRGEGYQSVSTIPRATGRAGGHWTTIWSRLPLVKTVDVTNEHRTVAAVLRAPIGELVVFGTVLPWHSDKGDNENARNWEEFYRVVPLQGLEWVRLRAAHPDAYLCVAGDLNMNLGGPHYYGTKPGRAMLEEALRAAGLTCLTRTERTKALLRHGPIDHICLSSRLVSGSELVEAWEGTTEDGVRLSDHSGLVVTVDAGAAEQRTTGGPVPGSSVPA